MNVLEQRKRTVAIDSLTPYPGNPRRGNIEAIKESLRENGQFRPIVVNAPTTEILAGNHTWRAAKELGWTKITAVYIDVDEEQARAIVLADNRTSDLGKYDEQALAALLEVQEKSKRGLEGTGYSRDQFQGLLERTARMPVGEPDPPARPKRPRTKPGEIVELGEHRLLCGDATDAKAIAKLMKGPPADVVWTDPPYGVDLRSVAAKRGRDHGDMEGDVDQGALEQLLRKALEVAARHAVAGASIYLMHAETNRPLAQRALEAAGWQHRQTLIWVKNTMVLGRQDYQWRHEPVIYGWKLDGPHRWHGTFSAATTVLEDLARAGRGTPTSEAKAAQDRVRWLVRSGKIERPEICEECGAPGKTEAAHGDYAKPEEVRWLCSKCHHRWDAEDPKGGTQEAAIRGALEELEHEDLVEIAWRLIEERPGTIVRVARPRVAELHPTSKPTALIRPMIRNSSPEGGIVLDPFAGSGSTMLACEQTGRRARMAEIDRGYCDVIRQRWAEYEQGASEGNSKTSARANA